VKASTIIQISIDSPVRIAPTRPEDYVGTIVARLSESTFGSGTVLPAGYSNRIHRTAVTALAVIDGPSRGGHNPRAMAATAAYAAEVALASIEGRKRLLSQREAASCADAAEYTVREQFVEIFKPRMESIIEVVRMKESLNPGPSNQRTLTLLQSPPR
jgi:transcription initiation factor TFIIIB Brf1 subunit/transcription initiation factor TFIIB